MTEQRYETGSAGGPHPDDQTREMSAVDVLHDAARRDEGPEEAGSTPLAEGPAVPVASAVPPLDRPDLPDLPDAAHRSGGPGEPAAGPAADSTTELGTSAAADDTAAHSTAPGPPGGPDAGATRAAAGNGEPDLTAEAAGLAAASRTTTPRRARTAPPARTRRARLHLRRVDPLSVFLLALLLSLFLAIVIVVAVVALYAVLAAAGVPDTINDLFAEITRASGEGQAQPEPLLTARRAVLAAGVLAAVDVVLLTVLATLGALLYNVCASFTGGLTVTLAEPEDR